MRGSAFFDRHSSPESTYVDTATDRMGTAPPGVNAATWAIATGSVEAKLHSCDASVRLANCGDTIALLNEKIAIGTRAKSDAQVMIDSYRVMAQYAHNHGLPDWAEQNDLNAEISGLAADLADFGRTSDLSARSSLEGEVANIAGPTRQLQKEEMRLMKGTGCIRTVAVAVLGAATFGVTDRFVPEAIDNADVIASLSIAGLSSFVLGMAASRHTVTSRMVRYRAQRKISRQLRTSNATTAGV